jgi:perosamine synthetase
MVEDAALALGSGRGGRYAGTYGIVGCFSFHPRKLITTGEGGAVCTRSPGLANAISSIREYGVARSAWARFQTEVGQLEGFARLAFNFKLTDIQAAIGRVQLSRLPRFLAARRRIADRYLDGLHGSPFHLPAATADHVWQAFVCSWQRGSQADFRKRVTARGIAISDAAQYLPSLPVFRPFTLAPRPAAAAAAAATFALPLYTTMTDDDIDRVIEAFADAAPLAQ